jgi:competence protein ComEA
MPDLSRPQLLVYGAIAVALLLVGARAIRAEGGGEASYAVGAEAPVEGGSADFAPAGGSADFSLAGGGPDVVVDVTGAVRRPGVYRLPAGARVTDAVARAGGASGEAELEGINLAARLADGQQVLVPGRMAGGSVAGAVSEEGPISLGSASVEQLETIDGIGPVTAGDIVEFRDEHGGLASVDQLDEVPGIGPATMEALRGRLQP